MDELRLLTQLDRIATALEKIAMQLEPKTTAGTGEATVFDILWDISEALDAVSEDGLSVQADVTGNIQADTNQ